MRKKGLLVPMLVALLLLITHQLYPHFHGQFPIPDQNKQSKLEAEQPTNILLVDLGPDHLQHFKTSQHFSLEPKSNVNAGFPVSQSIHRNQFISIGSYFTETSQLALGDYLVLIPQRGPPSL